MKLLIFLITFDYGSAKSTRRNTKSIVRGPCSVKFFEMHKIKITLILVLINDTLGKFLKKFVQHSITTGTRVLLIPICVETK
jgi:hypothetical protein